MEGWELQISASHSDGLGCLVLSFVFFPLFGFFFQICWWILFSWICCVKKKRGSFSVFLQAVVAQICGSVEGGVTLVCVPAGKLFPFSCLQNFLCSSSGFSLAELALRFRFALRSANGYKGTLAHGISAFARSECTAWALHDINVDVGIYEASCPGRSIF